MRPYFLRKVTVQNETAELNSMLKFLRPEDTLVVTDLTRLSRSTKDLIEITEISQKGAHLKSLKESWLDTTTAHGKMVTTQPLVGVFFILLVSYALYL